MAEPKEEEELGNKIISEVVLNNPCGVEEVKVEIYRDLTFSQSTSSMQKLPLLSCKPRSAVTPKGRYLPVVSNKKEPPRKPTKEQQSTWQQVLTADGQVCCPFPQCEVSYCSVRGLILHYMACNGTRDENESIKCKICGHYVSCKTSFAHHNRLLHGGKTLRAVASSSNSSYNYRKVGLYGKLEKTTKLRRKVRKPVRYRDNEESQVTDDDNDSTPEEHNTSASDLELFSIMHKNELTSASKMEVIEEYKKSSFLHNMGLRRRRTLRSGDDASGGGSDKKDDTSCEENGSELESSSGRTSACGYEKAIRNMEDGPAKSVLSSRLEGLNVINAKPVLPRKRGRPRKLRPGEEEHETRANDVESNSKKIKVEVADLPRQISFEFVNKEGNVSECTKCGVCKKEFANDTMFYNHILLSHNGLAKPDDCDQTFTEDERRDVLRQTFKKLGKLHCPQDGCRKPLISLLGYQHHVSNCTKDSKTLGSQAYEELLLDKKKKRMLQQMIRRDGKLMCPNTHCNKSLLTITGYLIHIKNCKSKDGATNKLSVPQVKPPAKLFTCGRCSSSFSQLNSLKSHMNHNHNGLARPEGESQEFTEEERAVVLKNTFRIVKKLRCLRAECNKKSFGSLGGYLYHEKHCGQQCGICECTICGKKLRESSLKYHMKTAHMPSPPPTPPSLPPEPDESENNGKRKAATKARINILQITRGLEKVGLPSDDQDDSDSNSENDDEDYDVPCGPKYTKPPVPFIPSSLYSTWRDELEKSDKITCKNKGCSESFTAPWQMCSHYKACEHGPYGGGYVCVQCGAKKRNEASMINHVESHETLGNGSDEELERENKGSGYSGRSRGKSKDSSFGPLTRAAQWTYKFQLENYQEVLFEKWKPLKHDWVRLSQEESETYTPKSNESMAFKTSLCSVAGVTSSAWEQAKLFDSSFMEEGDESVTVFTGGPIWAVAWCPTPHNQFADQFLAVSSHLQMDSAVKSAEAKPGPGLLQIWSLAKTESQNLSFRFCFGIAHDEGTIWQLQWCPSGCWEDPEGESEGDFLPRLGLLAAACSSGNIVIYSVPHSDALTIDGETALYKPAPTVLLQTAPVVSSPLSQNIPAQCFCLSWLSSKGHDKIAGGFSNGYLAIWQLEETPSLTCKLDNTTTVLAPYHSHQAHVFSVQSVDWASMHHGRFLATVGSDRKLNIWCSDDFSEPYIMRNGYGRFTKVSWPVHWSGVYVGFDDCFNYTRNYVTFVENGYFGNNQKPLVGHNGCIWDFAQSDWLNCSVSCDSTGEVVGTVLGHLYNVNYIKFLNKKRFPVYRTMLESLDLDQLKTERYDTSTDNENDPDAECTIDESTDEGSTATDNHATNDEIGSTPDKDDTKLNGKSEAINPDEQKQSPHRIASYEEAKCKYGIHFCDSLQATKKGWSAKESDRLSVPSTMTPASADTYPLTSVNRVAWNPNLGSHLYVASGGQSGLLRIHTLQWLDVRNTHTKTPGVS